MKYTHTVSRMETKIERAAKITELQARSERFTEHRGRIGAARRGGAPLKRRIGSRHGERAGIAAVVAAEREGGGVVGGIVEDVSAARDIAIEIPVEAVESLYGRCRRHIDVVCNGAAAHAGIDRAAVQRDRAGADGSAGDRAAGSRRSGTARDIQRARIYGDTAAQSAR